MKTKYFLIILIVFLIFPSFSNAEGLSSRLSGKILLQIESKGEAWYVNPENEKRYYLGRPDDAFNLMRELGLGISNKDFKLFNGVSPQRLAGKIVLKVEDKGQAYYVNPDDLKMHYLGRPQDAFEVMRNLGLGITNDNLSKIEANSTSIVQINDGDLQILGKVTDKSGEVVNKKLVYFVTVDGDDSKVVSFYESSNSNFIINRLGKGSYKLEIWLEEDLKNKGKFLGPEPIFSTILVLDDKNVGLKLKVNRVEAVKEELKIDQGPHWCNNKKFTACNPGFIFDCSIENGATCKKNKKKPDLDFQKMEKQVHAMINFKREKVNMDQFEWSDQLSLISRNHSKDMVEKDYFNYIEDGCDMMCRFNSASNVHSQFSENIFSIPIYKKVYDDETVAEYKSEYEIVETVADNWANNTDKEENLLSAKHKSQGIGVWVSNDNKLYASQETSNFLSKEEDDELKKLSSTLIKNSKTNKQRVEVIYEWITENIKYDAKGYTSGEIAYLNYSSVGAYRNKLAVCQGYAELARLMLSHVGIKSDVVTGKSYIDGSYEDHAWNNVYIDGEKLYFDSTWDAGYIDGDKFFQSSEKNYFLIPKTCIDVDHVQGKEETLSKEAQKQYVTDNLEVFNDKCLDLKEQILR